MIPLSDFITSPQLQVAVVGFGNDGDPAVLYQIVATLVGATGALLGAFGGAYLTGKSNSKILDRQLEHQQSVVREERFRANAEQLYQLFSRWVIYVGSTDILLYAVMTDHISYNQYLDELKNISGEEVDHVRVELLIRSYFPDLLPRYHRIIQYRDRKGQLSFDFRNAYKAGLNKTKIVADFDVAQKLFHKECDLLKDDIVGQLSRASSDSQTETAPINASAFFPVSGQTLP